MIVIRHRIDSPTRSVRGLLLCGTAVIAFTFLGLGGWAATTPLASASVASGTVAVSSRRQIIQHLEGGIIAQLLVEDGDFVTAGDLLVKLDDTKALASYELVRGQYLAALGEKSRLEAERNGSAAIPWAEEFTDFLDDPQIRRIILGQQNVFDSRQEYMSGQSQIIEEKKLQLEQEIEALQAQERAEASQLGLIKEEIVGVEDLFDRGLERRPRLLALQRAAAEIEGNRGELLASIARSRLAISELTAQFSDLKNRMMSETVSDLRETETKIGDLAQRLRAGRDILDRIEIRAPRSGYVVNMQYHTIGGVVEPGRAILDLVPSEDSLLIETRLDPKDIDVLKIGSVAEITLTPYSTRSVPPVQGTLVTLSADSLTDPSTGVAYYAARIEVNRSELEHLEGIRLVPGMPAQVMIRTGERTALQYLLDPFRKSIHRAFRES